MLEIELKMKVKDLSLIRERLLLHHATLLNKKHERDVYYNAPHRDFGMTDEALRIRFAGECAVMTYKGPKIKKYSMKAREELNTGVESGETCEGILQSLGFFRVAEVNKLRENFRYRGATISLDEVEGLGSYIEIEVMESGEIKNPSELIEKIEKELGIEGEPTLSSYLEMILSTRKEAQS
jgi:adenylyl cyclase CyaB, putative